LRGFEDKIRKRKEEEEYKEVKDKERFDKVRDLAANQRDKVRNMKTDLDNTLNQPEEVYQPQPAATYETVKKEQLRGLTNANLQKLEEENIRVEDTASPDKANGKKKKNKGKPKWALTEQELEQQEDKEVADLLNFADNLDYDTYINDLEVKNMVTALKKRIDDLKQEGNWKKKIVDQWNEEDKDKRQALKLQKTNIDMDNASDARSQASEAKSHASERTHQSIISLKEQVAKRNENKQEWDKSTVGDAKPQVSLEDRIAKHVADEILRGNTQIRQVHSNNSIRKILEKEARKVLEEPHGVPNPKIVNNRDYAPRFEEKDPSNLPYLHRNPAI